MASDDAAPKMAFKAIRLSFTMADDA